MRRIEGHAHMAARNVDVFRPPVAVVQAEGPGGEAVPTAEQGTRGYGGAATPALGVQGAAIVLTAVVEALVQGVNALW